MRNLAHDVDGYRAPNLLRNPIQAPVPLAPRIAAGLPAIHIFHTHTNLHIHHESSIEGDNIRRAAVMHDLQLSQNLLPHCLFLLDVDYLQSAP